MEGAGHVQQSADISPERFQGYGSQLLSLERASIEAALRPLLHLSSRGGEAVALDSAPSVVPGLCAVIELFVDTYTRSTASAARDAEPRDPVALQWTAHCAVAAATVLHNLAQVSANRPHVGKSSQVVVVLLRVFGTAHAEPCPAILELSLSVLSVLRLCARRMQPPALCTCALSLQALLCCWDLPLQVHTGAAGALAATLEADADGRVMRQLAKLAGPRWLEASYALILSPYAAGVEAWNSARAGELGPCEAFVEADNKALQSVADLHLPRYFQTQAVFSGVCVVYFALKILRRTHAEHNPWALSPPSSPPKLDLSCQPPPPPQQAATASHARATATSEPVIMHRGHSAFDEPPSTAPLSSPRVVADTAQHPTLTAAPHSPPHRATRSPSSPDTPPTVTLRPPPPPVFSGTLSPASALAAAPEHHAHRSHLQTITSGGGEKAGGAADGSSGNAAQPHASITRIPASVFECDSTEGDACLTAGYLHSSAGGGHRPVSESELTLRLRSDSLASFPSLANWTMPLHTAPSISRRRSGAAGGDDESARESAHASMNPQDSLFAEWISKVESAKSLSRAQSRSVNTSADLAEPSVSSIPRSGLGQAPPQSAADMPSGHVVRSPAKRSPPASRGASASDTEREHNAARSHRANHAPAVPPSDAAVAAEAAHDRAPASPVTTPQRHDATHNSPTMASSSPVQRSAAGHPPHAPAALSGGHSTNGPPGTEVASPSQHDGSALDAGRVIALHPDARPGAGVITLADGVTMVLPAMLVTVLQQVLLKRRPRPHTECVSQDRREALARLAAPPAVAALCRQHLATAAKTAGRALLEALEVPSLRASVCALEQELLSVLFSGEEDAAVLAVVREIQRHNIGAVPT